MSSFSFGLGRGPIRGTEAYRRLRESERVFLKQSGDHDRVEVGTYTLGQVGRHGCEAGHVERLRVRPIRQLRRDQVEHAGAVMNCLASNSGFKVFAAIFVSFLLLVLAECSA